MSEEQDKDSKTEQPTEKKLRDAMEKGNIPFSREVPIFASALAILVFFVFFLPMGAKSLTGSLVDIFEKPEELRLTTGQDAVYLFHHLFFETSAVLLPAFALMMAFGIAASILQNVPRPVLDRVQPKLSRVSLGKGLGRIYSAQGMVEFAKSVFKIVVVSAIIAFAMIDDFFSWLQAMFVDPSAILSLMSSTVGKILVIVLLATAVIAVVDILWTRFHWHNELRMSRQELKDEYKQSEGDPIVKSRQRSLARDRARKRMIAAVPRATLVITNPTHYAVALRYVRDEGGAPLVVAKGQDLIALKIREIAEDNQIPIFEEPPLARSIFAQVSVDSVIPTEFYKAVAELIHQVYSKSEAKTVSR
ncbi:flagellar biosynthesis protein FlhB [Pararhizobium haloflavum]|uniref:flagellar biosynthesis protein FlhB n=1 Tax=Pararhizobium haloflavum TaxID=2037914 RepID=UPI000C19F839|nr:flagellar biosynthesis protein FlhB [Pararhizobium haloflavum]